jgi:hypothetical protein
MLDKQAVSSKPGRNGKTLTLADLAGAKKLPVDFLRGLGLEDLAGGAVSIPYYDVAGELIATKRRTALKARDGSYWPKGKPLAPYGLWDLEKAYRESLLFLVEGESDTWALWFHGLPALGIPGANAAKCLPHEAIETIECVYVHREPDQGGEQFVRGVSARLRELGYAGKAFAFSCPGGVKDLADLHAQNAEQFKLTLQAMIRQSVPLDSGPPQFAPDDYLGDDAPEDAVQPERKKKEKLPATASDTTQRQAIVLNMAEVQPAPVEWLWRNWIPRGAITLLDGDPGLGKSTAALDIAARVSRGWDMPPTGGAGTREPGNVLVLTAEDDPARTVRPRLDAVEADVGRVCLLAAIKSGDDEFPPVLPWNIKEMEQIIAERKIALVIVDPVMAYLDEKVDSHKDQHIRRVLFQLAKLAQNYNLSVLCIRHLSKTFAVPALYRGGGSIGIIGAARSALLVGRHPEDHTARVLASNKSNLGPAPTSLAYRLDPAGNVARIAWLGEVEYGPNDILSHTTAKKRGPKPEALENATAFLKDSLSQGPVEAEELFKHVRAEAISKTTLKRAKKALGILVKEIRDGGGKVTGWSWSLPEGRVRDTEKLGPLDESLQNQGFFPEDQVSANGKLGPLDGPYGERR